MGELSPCSCSKLSVGGGVPPAATVARSAADMRRRWIAPQLPELFHASPQRVSCSATAQVMTTACLVRNFSRISLLPRGNHRVRFVLVTTHASHESTTQSLLLAQRSQDARSVDSGCLPKTHPRRNCAASRHASNRNGAGRTYRTWGSAFGGSKS